MFKQIVCDRLGLDPADIHYLQGDTDQVFYRRGHRRLALGDARRLRGRLPPPTRSSRRREAIAAHVLKADPTAVDFADGVFSRRGYQPTLTMKEVAQARRSIRRRLPRGHGAGPRRAPRSIAARSRTFPTAAMSASSRSTPRPARSRSCATASSTMSAPCSTRCCSKARSPAASRRASGQVLLRGHPLRCRHRPAAHRLVHGLRHAARRRPLRRRDREQSGADQDQSARRQGRRRSRHASARCRRSPMRWSMRSPTSASATSPCRRRRR